MKQPLSITLSPDLKRFVEKKVKAGQYPSPAHVVSSALEALRMNEQFTQNDTADIREEIAVGVAQLELGQSAPWDAKAMKARLRHEANRKR